MKIHIVQKGDTLWNLAEKYGVDFEQLKKANQQLANPDLIMPGMKIKIPSGAVPPKKEYPKHHVPMKELPHKVLPKEEVLPKKEIVKEIQVEVESPEIVKEKEVYLKELVLACPTDLLKKLLEEVKPDVINQIKIEVELENKKYEPHFHYAPPAVKPKYEKPKAYMPAKEMPCPPLSPYLPSAQVGGMAGLMHCPPQLMMPSMMPMPCHNPHYAPQTMYGVPAMPMTGGAAMPMPGGYGMPAMFPQGMGMPGQVPGSPMGQAIPGMPTTQPTNYPYSTYRGAEEGGQTELNNEIADTQ